MTNPSPSRRRRGSSTVGVHGERRHARRGDPVVPPIVQSATFYGGDGAAGDLVYTRYGNNPNQLEVGRKIAELEGMEAAVPLASGMAATAMSLLALTKAGDHVVASKFLYGATVELLATELPKRGVETTFVDPRARREWRDAVAETTRVLVLEIPTNPTLRVFDPRPLTRLAEERGILTLVDATFASPVNLRPADHGVDIVLHSATKYLGGHSDLVAGVVAGARPFVDEVTRMMKVYGPAIDPHAAWLLDRGLRTLDVRVRRQNENALALARWFENRDEVRRVIYPGLESHPDHGVARELMQEGFGGMVSIVLEGGGPAADRFAELLDLCVVAPSLGGVETLVSQPRYTSHVSLSPAERERAEIPDGFVRISVGVEDLSDLIEDFDVALTGAG